MLNVKTVDPERYIGLVQKGKPKNETYQKIRKDIHPPPPSPPSFPLLPPPPPPLPSLSIATASHPRNILLNFTNVNRTFMNDKDFANSVSQDKLARCLSAFARFCAESPGKANKLEYLLMNKGEGGRTCDMRACTSGIFRKFLFMLQGFMPDARVVRINVVCRYLKYLVFHVRNNEFVEHISRIVWSNFTRCKR